MESGPMHPNFGQVENEAKRKRSGNCDTTGISNSVSHQCLANESIFVTEAKCIIVFMT